MTRAMPRRMQKSSRRPRRTSRRAAVPRLPPTTTLTSQTLPRTVCFLCERVHASKIGTGRHAFLWQQARHRPAFSLGQVLRDIVAAQQPRRVSNRLLAGHLANYRRVGLVCERQQQAEPQPQGSAAGSAEEGQGAQLVVQASSGRVVGSFGRWPSHASRGGQWRVAFGIGTAVSDQRVQESQRQPARSHAAGELGDKCERGKQGSDAPHRDGAGKLPEGHVPTRFARVDHHGIQKGLRGTHAKGSRAEQRGRRSLDPRQGRYERRCSWHPRGFGQPHGGAHDAVGAVRMGPGAGGEQAAAVQGGWLRPWQCSLDAGVFVSGSGRAGGVAGHRCGAS